MNWDDEDPAERGERAAIEGERPSSPSGPAVEVTGPGRLILDAVRAAPGAITRPAHLLELVAELQAPRALDAAAELLDVGHLLTEGGALAVAVPPSASAEGGPFGEGTRAILRALSSAPNRERAAVAASPAVLLFAAFHRPGSIAWRNLREAVQGLKVPVRAWSDRVAALRPGAGGEGGERSDDGRAVVGFDRSRVDLAIEASIRHLRDDPNLYVRAGSLAFVVRVSREDERRQPFLKEDAPRVLTMSAATLLERLCPVVRFEVRSGDRVLVKGPPAEVVSGVLARGSWPGLRYLRGIIETPTIRPLEQGGTIVDRPGFDDGTGYLYAPPHNCQFPPVPERPSQDAARAALATLLDVFVDFPFEREEGRAAAVAAVLTLIARPAITGSVPLFAFDATTMGTGKGLAVHTIHMIATGRTAGERTLPVAREGVDQAELRKVLDSAALGREASLFFDNLGQNTPLGGDALEAIITGEQHKGRILGRTEEFSAPWLAVVFASGNNLSTTRDMLRRTVLVRLASSLENPDMRPANDYQRPERAGRLVQWARENRPRLVVAALTLLRAFIVAGAPRGVVAARGSFEAWAELVAGAIVWAGGADPTACILSGADAEESPDRSAKRVVVRDLLRLDKDRRGLSVKELLSLLYPPERVRGEAVPPDGFDDLREALEVLSPPRRPGGPPDPVGVGQALAGARGAVFGGLTIARAAKTAHGSLVRWRVEAVQAPGPRAAALVAGIDS